MKILLSAYGCAPGSGSEPGGGYAVLRAAAAAGECWVLTREKNVAVLDAALAEEPTPHPVHVVGVDLGPRAMGLKRRLGTDRTYYSLWQRKAGRVARDLDRDHAFDVVHHATFSSFWLPMGVARLGRPFVAGPLSGGCLTPRPLLRDLGPRMMATDLVRWGTTRAAGGVRRRQWAGRGIVALAQERQTAAYLGRHVLGGTAPAVHPHASEPGLADLGPAAPPRHREIVFVGRLVAWKGTRLALDVFARLDDPDARLVFMGDGPDRRWLADRAARLGLTAQVELTGPLPRDEVLRRMRRASALLFPSFHDSAGFVVSEALAMGLPVVCLDHGGPGELVRLWPSAEHVAVEVRTRRQVLADLTEAVRAYLRHPEPLPAHALAPSATLVDVLGPVYATVAARPQATEVH